MHDLRAFGATLIDNEASPIVLDSIIDVDGDYPEKKLHDKFGMPRRERQLARFLHQNALIQMAREVNRNPLMKDAVMRELDKQIAGGKTVVNEAAAYSATTAGLPEKIAALIASTIRQTITTKIFGVQPTDRPSYAMWFVREISGTANGDSYPAGSPLHLGQSYKSSTNPDSTVDGLFDPSYYTEVDGTTIIKDITNDLAKLSGETTAFAVRTNTNVANMQDFLAYFDAPLNTFLLTRAAAYLARLIESTALGVMFAGISTNVNWDLTGYTTYSSNDYFAALTGWEKHLLSLLETPQVTVRNATVGEPANIIVGRYTDVKVLRKLATRENSAMVLNSAVNSSKMGEAFANIGQRAVGVLDSQYVVYDVPDVDWPGAYTGKLLCLYKGGDMAATGIFSPYLMGYRSPEFTNPQYLTVQQALMDRAGIKCVLPSTGFTITIQNG